MKNSKQYLKITKAVCNEKRADIIILLHSSNKEMCVNEISSSVKMSQSLTSHQLKYLESNNIIEGHRVGQTICYKLCDNQITKKTVKIIKTLINI